LEVEDIILGVNFDVILEILSQDFIFESQDVA